MSTGIYNLPRQPLRDSSVAVFLLRFVFVGKGESVFSQTSFSLLSMNRRLVVIRFVTELSPAISLGRKSSGRWHRHKFIDSPCAKGEINLISIRAWQTFLTDCSSSGLLYNAREEMFSLVQLLGYLTLSLLVSIHRLRRFGNASSNCRRFRLKWLYGSLSRICWKHLAIKMQLWNLTNRYCFATFSYWYIISLLLFAPAE